jgi:hypothetical protein
MAQAYLQISEYSTLNFSNDWRQCEQWRRDYAQRVVVGDIVTVQYGVPKGLSQTWTGIAVRQYNLTTGVAATLSPSLVLDGDGLAAYNVTANAAAVGCYRVAIEVTTGGRTTAVAESVFEVVEEDLGSLLFRYQNEKDKDGTMFGEPFYFRCPAKFFPQNEEYGSEDNAFRDQEYAPSLLSSEAYTTYGLTVGGPQGVPTWVGRKLNAILSCTELYLGEVGSEAQFVKSDGAKIERVSLGEMNPLYQFGVDLEKVSDGILIGDYIPDEIVRRDIWAIIECYETITEEVMFDISPSTAFFAYNGATQTVGVTAADNSWEVSAADTSWLTATKNSDNTATITPAQNTGTANRSQNVTFQWTSPTTGVTTTRTLVVTQYAQAITIADITISGTVVDSSTGQPISNSASDVVRLSATESNSANVHLGYSTLDASGRFSKTITIDGDDWAAFTRIIATVIAPGYTAKDFNISAPTFANASTNGVQFGTLQLVLIPGKDIWVTIDCYEAGEVIEGPIVIKGKAVRYMNGPAVAGATVTLKADDTTIGTTTTDTNGNFSCLWNTTENNYNNTYRLLYTVSKSGYLEYLDSEYIVRLPVYAEVVAGGIDLGTSQIQKI